LSTALRAVLEESPQVFGAVRTDAGVHANGQVVSFLTRSVLPVRELQEQVNDKLPSDVCIITTTETPSSFHARHSAQSISYRYQISTRRTAFGKKLVWWIRSSLDQDLLGSMAAEIEQAHEFRSFSDMEPGRSEDPVRDRSSRVKILESIWYEDGDLLVYRITADRFRMKMVRQLVGTMVATALGQIEPGKLSRWLKERSVEPARHTAPPSGLFLEGVGYRDEETTVPAGVGQSQSSGATRHRGTGKPGGLKKTGPAQAAVNLERGSAKSRVRPGTGSSRKARPFRPGGGTRSGQDDLAAKTEKGPAGSRTRSSTGTPRKAKPFRPGAGNKPGHADLSVKPRSGPAGSRTRSSTGPTRKTKPFRPGAGNKPGHADLSVKTRSGPAGSRTRSDTGTTRKTRPFGSASGKNQGDAKSSAKTEKDSTGSRPRSGAPRQRKAKPFRPGSGKAAGPARRESSRRTSSGKGKPKARKGRS
jgi:tRNA pseudouridine38-40 synthase